MRFTTKCILTFYRCIRGTTETISLPVKEKTGLSKDCIGETGNLLWQYRNGIRGYYRAFDDPCFSAPIPVLALFPDNRDT